jgi:rare lipoprotein A
MKKTLKMLLIPVIMSLYISTPLMKGVFAFSDVSEGNKYYVAIKYLEENGIISGYSDGTFKPNEETNRAEALKMITLASGIITEEEIENSNKGDEKQRPFTDTPTSEWYTAYLKAAKEKGLIQGYEDGTYKPEQTINLAEALKITMESFNHGDYPEISDYLYIDTPEDEWFTKYTAYAGSKGIINIYDSNNVNPEQEMTRGYLAEIIYRYMMAKENECEFGKATFYGSAVQGHGTASGETFDMYKFTAAHKTLPFGTIVEVTNLANNKSVEVKINDRGPYGPGRILDLSSSAFEEIALLSSGVINVQAKVIQTQ